MDILEKKYRFTEIVTTVELLPDDPKDLSDISEVILPSLTKGLDDNDLSSALCLQAQKESDNWRARFYAVLLNSVIQNADNETITDSDMNAIAMAMSVAWFSQLGDAIFRAISFMYALKDKYDLEIPPLSYVVLDDPKCMELAKQLDPYDILEHNVDKVMEQVSRLVRE